MTRCGPIIVALLAGSALSMAGSPRQSSDAGPRQDGLVAVGLACGDGNFIPLAARRNGAWHALTEPEQGLSYFYSVMTREALRLPRQGWTLYARNAGSPRQLSLRAPRERDGGESTDCVTMQAFESNGPRVRARVAFPDGTTELRPVLGIGVWGPARFERGDDVTAQPDESSRRVAMRVVREVHAVERRLDRDTGDVSPLRRFAGRKEVRSVVRLLSMVRHRTDERDWYFFQAQKQHGEWYVFEGKRRYSNWAQVVVHGWVHVSRVGMSAFPAEGSFIDDTLKTGRFYQLRGLLILDDRVVWITEGSGYEWQWYELFETGPGDAPPHSVISIDTGGA